MNRRLYTHLSILAFVLGLSWGLSCTQATTPTTTTSTTSGLIIHIPASIAE